MPVDRNRPLPRQRAAGILLAPLDLLFACAWGATALRCHDQGRVDELTGSRRALSRGGFFQHIARASRPEAPNKPREALQGNGIGRAPLTAPAAGLAAPQATVESGGAAKACETRAHLRRFARGGK